MSGTAVHSYNLLYAYYIRVIAALQKYVPLVQLDFLWIAQGGYSSTRSVGDGFLSETSLGKLLQNLGDIFEEINMARKNCVRFCVFCFYLKLSFLGPKIEPQTSFYLYLIIPREYVCTREKIP